MDKQIRLGWILILTFIIPLIIYVKTLLPSVGFWDTGEFQTIPYTFDIGHPTGYPTYILLGKIYLNIFTFGTVAWRMNFFSALSVSLGLYIFSLLIKRLTNNLVFAILIPILFSINPYLWSIAIRADPHTLHFLFTNIFIYLSFRIIINKKTYYLPIISFVTGLALGNHMLSVFFIPPLAYLFLLGRKKIFFSIEMFLLGLTVYIILPIISSIKDPLTINYSLTTFEGFKRHVFGQDFQGMMNNWIKENYKDTISYYFSLFKNSFPFYLWSFVIAGLLIPKHKYFKFNLICIIIFFTSIFFSLRYQNASIERYFITSFLIGSIWLTICLDKIIKNHKFFLTKYGVYFYIIACILISISNNFIKINENNNTQAQEWARQSLSETTPNAIIFSWWSYSTPLWYLQKVENFRTDVTIVNSGTNDWEFMSQQFINKRDVYFIQKVNLNNKNLYLEQNVNLYKLIKSNSL